MSASRNKIVRRQLAETGKDKRTLAAEKEAKERRKTTIQYSIVAVLLVILFAFIFVYNSTWPSRHLTAVTIDGQEYTVAQMNFYYSSAYSSYYNNNYIDVLLGNAFDTQTKLSNQEYSEGVTWREHFLEEAVKNMTEIQYLNAQAEAAGFTLDEEHEEEYEEALHEINEHWAENNYSSLQQFINLNYGKGVTMELLETELHRTIVAEAYAESLRDAYEYTDAELAAYYDEHADEYDSITYSYYMISSSVENAPDADAMAKAIKGFTEDEFNAYLEENENGATATTLTYNGRQIADLFSEWLLDGARKAGDSTVITDETGDTSYVMLFQERSKNDYNLVSFRHVLLNAEDADGDGIYSEEELAAAVDAMQDIYDEWQAGAATEDSFAEIANEHSEDTGSNTAGGLYEDVYKGQMVENVNDWIFDPARQPGDTGIVTNEGSYTGAHLLYFVGAADKTYASTLAKSSLSSDDYEAWLEDATAGIAVSTSNLGLCGKNH